MASMKAEKPGVGTQLFGQVKKEPAKAAAASDGASKSGGSKPAPKKGSQNPQEAKKKGKRGKPAGKH
ncbi:hypothetical protein HS088_TW07G00892 [Tripterygium wilfordii]|uniref:Uncharacterized protein n=1 Tax=Tripterygium wilfordii TaxID=458696 RepID=A0A7J7DGA1_TRIWF|nr:hypothetical protein HS088_TW07G00892 [Tripterygium wilfordii]